MIKNRNKAIHSIDIADDKMQFCALQKLIVVV